MPHQLLMFYSCRFPLSPDPTPEGDSLRAEVRCQGLLKLCSLGKKNGGGGGGNCWESTWVLLLPPPFTEHRLMRFPHNLRQAGRNQNRFLSREVV